MLLNKLLSESASAQKACDELLGGEAALEDKAKRQHKVFVHCYIVAPHLKNYPKPRKKKPPRLLRLVRGRG